MERAREEEEKMQARPVYSKRKGRRGVFVHRKALNGRRCVGASLATPFEVRYPIQTVLSDVAVVVAGRCPEVSHQTVAGTGAEST